MAETARSARATPSGMILSGQGLSRISCLVCEHTGLLTADFLLRLGLDRHDEVLDLQHRMRCRGCGVRGRALIWVRWTAARAVKSSPGSRRLRRRPPPGYRTAEGIPTREDHSDRRHHAVTIPLDIP